MIEESDAADLKVRLIHLEGLIDGLKVIRPMTMTYLAGLLTMVGLVLAAGVFVIGNLSTAIQGLDTKIGALDTKIQAVDTRLSDRIQAVDTRVSTLSDKVSALSDQVAALPDKINFNLQQLTSTLSAAITASKQAPPQIILLPAPAPQAAVPSR